MKITNTMPTLPQDWQVKPLREFAYLNKGISYKSEDYSKDESGYIFVNLKCIKKFGGFSSSGIKYFKGFAPSNKKLLTGDLLIANTDLTRDGDVIGCPTLLPKLDTNQEITMSMDLSKVEVNENLVNKNYINFYLTTPTARKFMKDHSSGSTVLHLQTSKVPNMIFILPKSKLEQEKIAEILLTIDEAISGTELLIEKYKSIKQGLMQDLFRYGIDEKGQIRSEKTHKFKDSPLGRIPEEWEIGVVTDYLEIMTDYVANGSFASLKENVRVYDTENFAYYVRLFDLRLGLGHKNQTYTDKGSYEFLRKSFLEHDDILIANIGAYAGEVWLVPHVNKPATIAPNMLILKQNNQCSKKYLYYHLISEKGDKQIKNVIGGSGQPKISKTELKTIKIIKMSKNEQAKIVDVVTQADDTIQKEEEYGQKLDSLKQGLMEDLLSGKVRVNKLLN